MHDVTQILNQIESGDPSAAEKLMPLVYDELRRLATAKLAHEKPGQTLQATALVHDAYIRLVDVENSQKWDSRGHFFAAAAEAMRDRIGPHDQGNLLLRNIHSSLADTRKSLGYDPNRSLEDEIPEQVLQVAGEALPPSKFLTDLSYPSAHGLRTEREALGMHSLVLTPMAMD